jgi:hypothetical protein
MRVCRAYFRAAALALFLCAVARSADDPIVPLSVCEVLRDLSSRQGKDVAVIGRYSFREDGSWVSEQVCDPANQRPPQFWLVEDSNGGPKLPENFILDAAAIRRKLADIGKRTSLGKFRFGTPDYDRWAVIYGRVEPGKDGDKKASGNLVIRGSGVVVFVQPE